MNARRVSPSGLTQQLVQLFHQAAEDHHGAYATTDGVDPDWPIWYADHLLENDLERLLGAKLLKSDLIYLLVLADKMQTSKLQVGNGSAITRFPS